VAKFAGMQATALALIQRSGTSVTVTRKNAGTFDPVTQQETGSTRSYSLPAVVSRPDRGDFYEGGTLARRNAIRLTFAQKGALIEPRPGDTVRWKGEDWTIFYAAPVDPAGDGSIVTSAYAER
jgi:hypothetical protein